MLTAAKEGTFSASSDACVFFPLAAAGVYPKTRVWGSSEKSLHCFSATAPLNVELHWGCENSSEKTAVGSALDYNGNTQTMVSSSGTTTYAWDFENRLTSIALPGSGGTVSFKYDPFGRRIYKSSSSTTSIYAYDGDNLIEETNSTGAAVARYSQGLNIDEPLVMLRSGTTSYYQADGLGSLTSLSNTSGALASTYTYDGFGNLVASSGSIVNNFRYTGREFDPETSLYYYRARYYDASTGRFLTEDPLAFAAGMNKYRYARNSPLNWVDGFGTSESSCGCPNDNSNRMPRKRRLGLAFSGLANVIGGAAAMGLALAGEAGTAGMGTPIAAYVAVQGAGHFTQGMTEVLVSVVGDNSGEALVNSATDATNSLSILGLAGRLTHNREVAAFGKNTESAATTALFEHGNVALITLEAAHALQDLMSNGCQ